MALDSEIDAAAKKEMLGKKLAPNEQFLNDRTAKYGGGSHGVASDLRAYRKNQPKK